MSETLLRVLDAVLALFWAAVLLRALATGQIGLRSDPPSDRKRRPLAYFFFLFVFALMVVHFAGLAVVGQTI